MRTLDPRALAKVGSLALVARRVVEGALAGLHRSPFHGASVEFSEHKEYSPGDDLRHLDWKVFAKNDRYYIKRFEKETELSATIVLDSSGSMGYAGQGASKLHVAAQLASALAYLLLRQQDACGLLTFGGEDRVYVPPRARSSHLHDMLGVIEGVLDRGASGDKGLAAALDELGERMRHRRSVVIVLSDLFDTSAEVALMLRRLAGRGHDVAVFHVLDRDELELPFEGLTHFESMESPRKILADPRAVRDAYLQAMGRFLEDTRRSCAESGVQHLLAPTDVPLVDLLLEFLTARTGNARRRVKRAS